MTDEDAASTIDVVIVAFNSAARLRALLPTIVGAYGIGTVVVVDHGADGSAGIAEAAGAVSIRDASNPGFGAGQNNGRRLTTAPFVLVLNPDLTIDIGAVTRVSRSLRGSDDRRRTGRHPGGDDGRARAQRRATLRAVAPLGAADPRPRACCGSDAVRGLARRSARFSDHVDRVSERPRPVEAARRDCDPVPSRSALNSVDGFDERIFMYGEDQDLCVRLGAAGWRLLTVPEDWAVHGDGESALSSWNRELGVLERNVELRSAELVDAGMARRSRGRDRPSAHVDSAATAPIPVCSPRSRGRTDPSPARPTR